MECGKQNRTRTFIVKADPKLRRDLSRKLERLSRGLYTQDTHGTMRDAQGNRMPYQLDNRPIAYAH